MISPVGRLDQSGTPAFEDKLLALAEGGDEPKIVVDFSLVDYISSIGLRAIVLGAKASASKAGEQVVAGLPPVIGEVFAIARFEKILRIFETVDEGVAALSQSATNG